MRLSVLSAAIGLCATACQDREPSPPSPPPAVQAPTETAPVSATDRRRELQVQSAENQIEAQMQAQLDSQAASTDKTDH